MLRRGWVASLPGVGVQIEFTDYHAKYYAHDLTRRSTDGLDRLSAALFDAAVDLNPHQIEAALFALESPLSQGALLADEVGLGKTIEAGIVLCQYWAERRRRLLVICPASLRKQWAMELEEKFHLPSAIIDAHAYRAAAKEGREALRPEGIVIISMPYAHRLAAEIRGIAWDLVVIDEAHKLRNAYRPSNKVGQAIRWATEGRKTLLLTATPLQNSLVELFGLSTLIDEHFFGDLHSFRSQFTRAGSDMAALRRRLAAFCRRTLRNQVTEYVRYTERRALTVPFEPQDEEQALYEAVSDFLRRPDTYALPERQRHLTALIIRKLLASSPPAIAATLDTLRTRLEALQAGQTASANTDVAERILAAEELETDLLDEILSEAGDGDGMSDEENDGAGDGSRAVEPIDRRQLAAEISELQRLATWARSMRTDTKARALLTALETGFRQMESIGAARKALIFTESRRTQDYLHSFLEHNGFAGRVVLFNGTNSSPQSTVIYEDWQARNAETGRAAGSRDVDVRTALIEYFRDTAEVMIATEAGAEGVNLQFCALVINYDLPWNPQRIEQRIGRCHRYGQRHDVVVVNFLNERNEVDRRVLQLLGEKFRLFSGVFGASDDVLGVVESGVDFERRILDIYEQCRTPEEIEQAFVALQAELEEQIASRLGDTRRLLFEHFDEDVHERLRLRLADAQSQLDRVGKRFWALTRHMLADHAVFNDERLDFDLHTPPHPAITPGRYHLISKTAAGADVDLADTFLYRLTHPLGQHVLDTAREQATAPARVEFNLSRHPTHISVVEALTGRRGHLTLLRLVIDTYDREEYLLFSGLTSDGHALDQETLEKLFAVGGRVAGAVTVPADMEARLAAEAERHARATISRSLETNSRHFNHARERLEQWAEDKVLAAEKALKDTKEKIKVLRREARQASTLEEQHAIQQQMQVLERRQRRQRQEIFRVEDEIMEKRDALIGELERRLVQQVTSERLFTIEWAVV